MRDNLILSGIPERTPEDPKATIRAFISEQLKLPAEAVQSIRFEHFKQKGLVQYQSKHLKGTDFGLNDQYPKESITTPQAAIPHPQRNERRKKESIENKS